MNVPLKDIKKNLSYWAEEAHKGSPILVTKYNRPYVLILSGEGHGVLRGSKVGLTELRPALTNASKGKWLEYLLKDRDENGS